jgi:hypothetical protein
MTLDDAPLQRDLSKDCRLQRRLLEAIPADITGTADR